MTTNSTPTTEWQVGGIHEWWGSFTMIVIFLLADIIVGNVFKGHTKITYDVIENLREPSHAKEAVRNVYVNLTLVSALMLTVGFGMLFLSDHYGESPNRFASHLYLSCTGYAVCQYLRITMECVVNLVYTEALSNYEILCYLVANSGSIGGPVSAMFFASASLLTATVIFAAQVYSVAGAVAVSGVSLYALIAVVIQGRMKSRFTTDRAEPASRDWSWAESEDAEIPAAMKLKWPGQQAEVLRTRMMKARAQLDDSAPGDKLEVRAQLDDDAPGDKMEV